LPFTSLLRCSAYPCVKYIFFIYLLFLVVLQFELRALYLLGRHSAT
jgi:hypothetical protein